MPPPPTGIRQYTIGRGAQYPQGVRRIRKRQSRQRLRCVRPPSRHPTAPSTPPRRTLRLLRILSKDGIIALLVLLRPVNGKEVNSNGHFVRDFIVRRSERNLVLRMQVA